MPDIAIVILNWNGLLYLKKFLGTVLKYSDPAISSVYIADNGSSDDSVRWLQENHKEVNLVKLGSNHGFAAGYNLALENIDTRYYLLLNSDVEVTEGWLTPLLRHMEDYPLSAACMPKILSWHLKDHFEYAGASGGYIDKYGYPFCRGRVFSKVEKDTGQYNDVARVFWSTGACMLIRAEAWKECGGFDPAFFAHMEEIDLCWRLNRAGYSIECVPSSVVYHVGGGTLSYDSPFKTYLNFRNSLFLLYKNLDEKVLRKTILVRRLLDGIAAVVFLLQGHPKSFLSVWKAHIDYYKSLPALKSKRHDVQKMKRTNYSGMILNKSIVFEFYARGRKTFSSLNMSIKQE